MTEKRDLNNELILMKKTIQQAKVCVIGKLVRKLKSLTNEQGKELPALKLMTKRKRLTEQINYLKKTPNLDLASSALTFNKDPTKIITSQLSSIEDASLATIVTYKTVSAKVNEIKAKLGLDDSGKWRQCVSGIGKKKKKKIEKETNKNRNKERKEENKKHNELVKKRDEWLGENLEANEDTPTDDNENVSPSPSVKREKKKANDFVVTDIVKPKNPTKKKSTPEPLKIADPFFLTGTGETYLATKVVDRIQANGPNDGLDRKGRRAQQFGGAPKTIPKRINVPAVSSTSKQSIAPPDMKGIHPSWAAKMKSKGIDEFKGKKMKFDDEDTSNAVRHKVAPHQATQPKEDQEKIHPSWAAKQKLKPVISEFKGNKIVFDD